VCEDERSSGLTQAKDQPTIVGAQVLAKILYRHAPLRSRANETSVKAITRDDVVAFQKAYFQPGRANHHGCRRF